jgi:hypothetical protein
MTYTLAPVTEIGNFGTNITRFAVFKTDSMRDEDIVFKSDKYDDAVRELTRLRLSCSSGACED